jgi:hypothetical protein
MPSHDPMAERRQRIIAGLQGRSLEQAIADNGLWRDIQEEAASPDPDRLVPPDLIRVVEEARVLRVREPHLSLFFSTDDVIIVPGFMGSALLDVAGGNGLIWINPRLVLCPDELLLLKLGPYDPRQPDRDEVPSVVIRAEGAVPLIYAGLQFDLEVRRYSTQIFGVDWRKELEESARALAALVRDRASRRFRPLHLVAHSQGSLVARRALQLLGADLSRQLVKNLVLLGPASGGTLAAALAIAGTHETIEAIRRFGIRIPPGIAKVFQSMTGLYQLLPWRTEPVDRGDGTARLPEDAPLDWLRQNLPTLRTPQFWKTGVDPERLASRFCWGKSIDTSFFNDRTTIILGDRPTVGGVKFEGDRLVEDERFRTPGDGTVPDAWARLPGVNRVYRARSAAHMMLPLSLAVIAAVRDVLAGRAARVEPVPLGAAAPAIPVLAEPKEAEPAAHDVRHRGAARAGAVPAAAAPRDRWPEVAMAISPPRPQERRLRVFSYDPLLATNLEDLGTEQITLRLPWGFTDGDQLEPGPVGEYVEVVDYDPANRCFYPPVDLNHPHLLAQDGFPPSEGDPRFHQQMAYAVVMNTIHEFQAALGRVALWGPNLKRDEGGEVFPSERAQDEFVQRLRIYPHALREANAFYDPDKKALLFGYFPAQDTDVGGNLPGGTVFACLSHDIIAHETTHALLDGLHRYLTEPSNPDVFAFHEALADIVALFQHFSHPKVLSCQIARTRGDLRRESMLGALARQFGLGIGQRGALRQYLGRKDADGVWRPIPPDRQAIGREWEPHARGAILVAALFRAFTNIYDNRVEDLRRIATGGTGIFPDGDLHPDLVGRLADEAAKSARHMLAICVRALDYIPPVDVTFGEYLRGLITADYDLVRDDDRRYRVSVVSAFRDWGIYPSDVRSLSVESLLWSPPEIDAVRHVKEFFADAHVGDWDLSTDRRATYARMQLLNARLHDWLGRNVQDGRDRYLGLALDPKTAPQSIAWKNGRPVFEVHATRPCRRIGPDGQERTDVVVEVVQRRKAFFNVNVQEAVDKGTSPYDCVTQDFYYRGGCALILDPETGEIRYCIRKAICKSAKKPWEDERLIRERRFRQGQFGDPAGGAYLGEGDRGNPFAFLHRGA